MERASRRQDPATSEEGVRRVLRDSELYEAIVRAAGHAFDLGKPFTDSWLARRVGRPRNIVARKRLQVEQDGWVRRTGAKTKGGPDEAPQLLFEMPPAHRALLRMVAPGGIVDDQGER